jgi:hypothetical protein
VELIELMSSLNVMVDQSIGVMGVNCVKADEWEVDVMGSRVVISRGFVIWKTRLTLFNYGTS